MESRSDSKNHINNQALTVGFMKPTVFFMASLFIPNGLSVDYVVERVADGDSGIAIAIDAGA